MWNSYTVFLLGFVSGVLGLLLLLTQVKDSFNYY